LKWEAKCLAMIKEAKCRVSINKIKLRLKTFKGKERNSKELSQLHYDYLKSLF
jgi:hypothetical protein